MSITDDMKKLDLKKLAEMQKKAGDLKKLLDESAKDLAQDGAAIAERGKAIKGLM
jgi:hypothetical protein